ncbi:MAG: SpoIIE family protein phosphatase [Planctomycetota bacterium]|jgi:sigma-B regulation protein RsbU (phosphoserine phosphatase)|nr:SpoIIE family protein phosphatase [Planctomycetota bacterium]
MKVRDKVLRATLTVSLGVVLLLGGAGVLGLLDMRRVLIVHNSQLREMAATDTRDAIVAQQREQLLALTQSNAWELGEKFRRVQEQTRQIAAYATQLFTHPELYLSRPVAPPLAENVGTSVPYGRLAPTADRETARREMELAANCAELLQDAVRRGNIRLCGIGGAGGFSIFAHSAMPAAALKSGDYDPRPRPWYLTARAKDDLTWTPIFSTSQGLGDVIDCVMPFYDLSAQPRRFCGVVFCSVLLDTEIDDLTDVHNLHPDWHIFFIGEDRQIIFDHEEDRDLLPQIRAALADAPTAAVPTLHSTPDEQVLLTVCPLPNFPWQLGMFVPVSTINAPMKKFDRETAELETQEINYADRLLTFTLVAALGMVGVVGVATGYVGVKLANALTAPLGALTADAGLIAGGDFSHQLTAPTGAEIAALTAAFSRMLVGIHRGAAEKERLGAELAAAEKIRAGVSPNFSAVEFSHRGVDLDLDLRQQSGACFYDFYALDGDRLFVLTAAVAGAGAPAALLMIIAKTLLHNYVAARLPLAEVFAVANQQLCEHNDAAMPVTALAGVFDSETGTFTYVNAGNPPPAWRRQGKPAWIAESADLALGVVNRARYRARSVKLARDDMLLFYAADPRGNAVASNAVASNAVASNAVAGGTVAPPEKLLAALNAVTARDCAAAAKTAFAAAPQTYADVALMALRRV